MDRFLEAAWVATLGLLVCVGVFTIVAWVFGPDGNNDPTWPKNPNTVMVTGPGYTETWQGAVRLSVSGDRLTVDGKTLDGHGYQIVYLNAEKATVIDSTPATHSEEVAK